MSAHPAVESFLDESELSLGADFLAAGHVILPVEDREALESLRRFVANRAAEHLDLPLPRESEDLGSFLDGIHGSAAPAQLNALRLAILGATNDQPWTRRAYFRLAKRAVERLCGSELAMQRRLSLSVQLPGDASSLLQIHSDVWSGDSPYEVVVWLPLVDCHDTKSMYLVSPTADRALRRRFGEFKDRSAEDLYAAAHDSARFLTVNYGEVLVFSPTLLHGNRVNEERTTRWSMNVRFKSLFSPYGDKSMGSFFEPVTLRPATRLALAHFEPEPLDE